LQPYKSPPSGAPLNDPGRVFGAPAAFRYCDTILHVTGWLVGWLVGWKGKGICEKSLGRSVLRGKSIKPKAAAHCLIGHGVTGSASV